MLSLPPPVILAGRHRSVREVQVGGGDQEEKETYGRLLPSVKKPHGPAQSPTPAGVLPSAAHSRDALTCHTRDPHTAALPDRLGHWVPRAKPDSPPLTPRRPRSPPGPPRPFAVPCSPLPPWLRHLRGHLATRTAGDFHPHPATAWSPGSRLASPGTSRHGPSLAAGARACAMVAKRRKPAGRR